MVDFGKVEVRKRPVADVAVPEATSASYLKRLPPRQTKAAGSGGRADWTSPVNERLCSWVRYVLRWRPEADNRS